MQTLQFEQWLQNRDVDLYNEISFQDLKKAGQTAWPYIKKTGQIVIQLGTGLWNYLSNLIGEKRLRSIAASATGGVLTLAILMNALAPDEKLNIMMKSYSMSKEEVIQLQEAQPETYQMMLDQALQGKELNKNFQTVMNAANATSKAQDQIIKNNMQDSKPVNYQNTMDQINQILGKK